VSYADHDPRLRGDTLHQNWLEIVTTQTNIRRESKSSGMRDDLLDVV